MFGAQRRAHIFVIGDMAGEVAYPRQSPRTGLLLLPPTQRTRFEEITELAKTQRGPNAGRVFYAVIGISNAAQKGHRKGGEEGAARPLNAPLTPQPDDRFLLACTQSNRA